MDESSEKKLRSLKLKLVMAEKELQAAAGKWQLGGFLGAGHANAMNREVDKVKSRLTEKIEKINLQISEITGIAPAPKPEPAPKKVAEKPAQKPAEKKTEVVAAPAPKKTETKKTADKTEKASVKKPAQKSAGKSAKKK